MLELHLCGRQAIITLDKGGIEANGFLGVGRGLLVLSQTGVRGAAIGKEHVILGIASNGIGVVLNGSVKLLVGKGSVAESESIINTRGKGVGYKRSTQGK